jgi:menaquinone-dependent protoporphyrinogen oxidase
MAHILLLYGTTEGQTRKIAAHVADRIRDQGHTVEMVASTAFNGPVPAAAFDGVLVAASVHAGRHQGEIVRIVKANLTELLSLPSAFLSVSLAVLDEPHHEEAQGYVDQFLDETGWAPDLVETVAGALRYTKYGFVKRFIMKQISKRSGRPTDTSRDFEFTDWQQVARITDRFLQHVVTPEPEAASSTQPQPTS